MDFAPVHFALRVQVPCSHVSDVFDGNPVRYELFQVELTLCTQFSVGHGRQQPAAVCLRDTDSESRTGYPQAEVISRAHFQWNIRVDCLHAYSRFNPLILALPRTARLYGSCAADADGRVSLAS